MSKKNVANAPSSDPSELNFRYDDVFPTDLVSSSGMRVNDARFGDEIEEFPRRDERPELDFDNPSTVPEVDDLDFEDDD